MRELHHGGDRNNLTIAPNLWVGVPAPSANATATVRRHPAPRSAATVCRHRHHPPPPPSAAATIRRRHHPPPPLSAAAVCRHCLARQDRIWFRFIAPRLRGASGAGGTPGYAAARQE
jgi:hypothetical protein